jgi:hypothetical protein
MADEKIEEPKKEKEEEKLPLLEEPITVSDYLYLSILSLEGKAWAYMDLVVHPETQKHKKDLTEAKLAIDAMDALFRLAEAHLSSEQKKEIQYRLTNLRLNFVKG